MDRIRRTWARRTTAEYRSAALTAELLHWLVVLALSPDTLAICHRIVADELAHAELSRAVFLAAGGDAAALPMAPEALSLGHEPGQPLPLRALAVTADVFCCGETVALPLFLHLQAQASAPVVVAAFDRIVRDEAVHRAFGWQLLDELLERFGDEARTWLSLRTGGYITGLQKAYAAYGVDCTETERAWGLMEPARYGDIARTTADEVLVPWFQRRGVWSATATGA